LSVLAGLKEPQSLPEQLTLQLTPAPEASLLTMAATLAVVPMLIEDGGAVLKATEMGYWFEPPPPPHEARPTSTVAASSPAPRMRLNIIPPAIHLTGAVRSARVFVGGEGNAIWCRRKARACRRARVP
jgi:hypothetical protein